MKCAIRPFDPAIPTTCTFVQGTTVTLHGSDPLLPYVLTGAASERRAVLMPMRVDNMCWTTDTAGGPAGGRDEREKSNE